MSTPLTLSARRVVAVGNLTTATVALAALLLGTARLTSAQAAAVGGPAVAARGLGRPHEGQTPGRPARHDAPLTVDGAVALARANNPAVVAASMRRRSSAALARQDAAFANPVLEWRQENLGSPLRRDAFATISQPLDLTGRRFALRSAAHAVDRRAVADSVAVVRDVEATAARAYWRASLARSLLTLAEAQRRDADRLARLEAERAREGAVAEVSAIRTGVEHDRARVLEASARVSWTQSIGELARATGVPTGSLPPVLELAAALPRGWTAPSAEASIAYALAHRSELLALRAAENAAGHRLAAERRATLPDVVLQAGTKQTAGYSTRVIGVAVPLPLFNTNAAARDRAAAELDLMRTERQAMEQVVRTSVTVALDSYHALLAAEPAGADSVVARATEVAAIADAAYAAGGSSLLELLDARRARAEALTAVLRWVADVRLAEIDLRRALGASPTDGFPLP